MKYLPKVSDEAPGAGLQAQTAGLGLYDVLQQKQAN